MYNYERIKIEPKRETTLKLSSTNDDKRAMKIDTDTYYTQTEHRANLRSKLYGTVETDICIIGGGLAGINTLLELSEKNISAVLLEENRLGSGASGRNGGFLSAGYSVPIKRLERRLGRKYAQDLYRLSAEGIEIVRRRCQNSPQTEIDAEPGIVRMSWGKKENNLNAQIDYMNSIYETNLSYWSESKVAERYSSKKYSDAIFNPDAYQLHSLNYIHKCAVDAESLGAKIFEETTAINITRRKNSYIVCTNNGHVKANTVVICTSACQNYVSTKLYNAILPIGTYVLLTEPLFDRLTEAIRSPYAVSDSRRVENYYRPLRSTQILWGGGISTRLKPNNLKQRMLKDLLKVYPQLSGISAKLAWSGTMGYATHSMPQIGKLEDNIWYLQGFGGHGLNTTAIAGNLIARAIVDDDDTYELFSPFRLNFVAKPLGLLGAELIYLSWKTKDLLDEYLG